MQRLIANYTHILTDDGPRRLINHVTTIDDDNRLVSVTPFTRELPNTRYIDRPVTILNAADPNAPITPGTIVTVSLNT